MLQLLITIGIAAGYFIAYGSSRLDSSLAWRIPFIVEACVAVMLSIGMPFMPFSPRWLVQRGRFEEAREVLSRLCRSESVDEKLHGTRGSLEEEGTQQATFLEVFSKRYIKRSLLGIFLDGISNAL
ncbi:general substrate transporter [Lanmaoa asiatica]|nr:general substrate transporter [Lanmaoa asiatica]